MIFYDFFKNNYLTFFGPFFFITLFFKVPYFYIYAIHLLYFFCIYILEFRQNLEFKNKSFLIKLSFCFFVFTIFHFCMQFFFELNFSSINFFYTLAMGCQFYFFSFLLNSKIDLDSSTKMLIFIMKVFSTIGLYGFFSGALQVANPFELPYILTINRSYFSFLIWLVFILCVNKKKYLSASFFYFVILLNFSRIIIFLSIIFFVTQLIIRKNISKKEFLTLSLMFITTIISVINVDPLKISFKRMFIIETSSLTNNNTSDIHGFKSDKNRLNYLKISLNVIKNNWLLGVGAGNYWKVANRFVDSKTFYLKKSIGTPHNTYLYYFAIYGILGLIFLILILGSLFYMFKSSKICILILSLFVIYLCFSEPLLRPMTYYILFLTLLSERFNYEKN